jgi:hypothetical protein
MSKSSQADQALAFVDVITNGLGGMLILFFLVILLQTQLEWKDSRTPTTGHKGRDSSPFVLIVKTKDGAAAFDPKAKDSVWQFQGMPAGEVSTRRGVHWDWGTNYGLFVANRPPSLNARASIATPPTPTTFVVELYPAGAPRKVYEVESTVGTTFTEVWPAIRSR